MAMRGRNTFDLSHYVLTLGEIGRLQTLAVYPIVAGDTFDVDIAGVFRLSPLRRNLTLDARVDMFAFFVPHRHIYGDDWIDFIQDASDETETFPGTALTPLDGATGELFGMAVLNSDTVPRWRVTGMNRIWNRYFRFYSAASDSESDEKPDFGATLSGVSDLEALYGYRVAHLPTIWNTWLDPHDDGNVPSYDVTASNTGTTVAGLKTTIDLGDLAEQAGKLKNQVDRQLFSSRYYDVLNRTWQTRVNIDADQRPELCGKTSFWLSGYDVDGTGEGSLGSYSGKAAVTGRFRMPNKLFKEHGALWIVMCVRFPPIIEDERGYLESLPNPSYAEISGDPDLLSRLKPVDFDLRRHFSGATTKGVSGVIPYAQWLRYHNTHVHNRFGQLDGFPFMTYAANNLTGSGVDDLLYVDPGQYNDVFSSVQQLHWQCQLRHTVTAKRFVPDPLTSYYAGTKL